MKTFVQLLFLFVVVGLFSTEYINRDVEYHDGIELFFAIDEYDYETGDHINIKLRMTNLSGEPRPYYWSNSYTHDCFVYHIPGDTIWTMIDIILPVVTEGTLEHGDSLVYLYNWNMIGDDGMPIDYGNNYHMYGYFITDPCFYLHVDFDYDETGTTKTTIADIGTSNHPNPFNPSTTIRYQLSEVSEVSLSIYNIKGQLVRTLVNDMKSAGEHSIIWNGMDNDTKPVPSGVYLYQIKANDQTITKKMQVVK